MSNATTIEHCSNESYLVNVTTTSDGETSTPFAPNDYASWHDACDAALDIIDVINHKNGYDYDATLLIDAQNNDDASTDIAIVMRDIYDDTHLHCVSVTILRDETAIADEISAAIDARLANASAATWQDLPADAVILHNGQFEIVHHICPTCGAWKDEDDAACTTCAASSSDDDDLDDEFGHDGIATPMRCRYCGALDANGVCDDCDAVYANLPPIGGGSHELDDDAEETTCTYCGERTRNRFCERCSVIYPRPFPTFDADDEATAALSTSTGDTFTFRWIRSSITSAQMKAEAQMLLDRLAREHGDVVTGTYTSDITNGVRDEMRSTAPNRKHYHVLANTVGYMPDSNDVYRTRKDAEAGAKWTKDEWLEGWPGCKVRGNKRDGYLLDREPGRYSIPVSIQVVACEDNCALDDDDEYADLPAIEGGSHDLDRAALDRYITGNWGEDSVSDDDERCTCTHAATRSTNGDGYGGMFTDPTGCPVHDEPSAHLQFDSSYAPCSVLIVPDGADYKDDDVTVLIQGDDAMQALAEGLGWSEIDGESWHDFLRNQEGCSHAQLLDYLHEAHAERVEVDPYATIVTIEHRSIPFASRSGSRAPAPDSTGSWEAVDLALYDDTNLARTYGDPVTEWLQITPTKRQRQYVRRDASLRVDHHVTLTIEQPVPAIGGGSHEHDSEPFERPSARSWENDDETRRADAEHAAARAAQTSADTMRVTVRDRAAEPWGHGLLTPIVRTIEISAFCPKCGERRGTPTGLNEYDDGCAYHVNVWHNACGHIDTYREVIIEAAAIAAARAIVDPAQAFGEAFAQALQPFEITTHEQIAERRVQAFVETERAYEERFTARYNELMSADAADEHAQTREDALSEPDAPPIVYCTSCGRIATLSGFCDVCQSLSAQVAETVEQRKRFNAPFHERRRWNVYDVESAAELAEKLTQQTWCLCNAFRIGGYLFLNDATHEDGAGEFAVVRESDFVQIESITFSWCTQSRALAYIEQALAGQMNEKLGYVDPSHVTFNDRDHHCDHCA